MIWYLFNVQFKDLGVNINQGFENVLNGAAPLTDEAFAQIYASYVHQFGSFLTATKAVNVEEKLYNKVLEIIAHNSDITQTYKKGVN